MQQALQIKLVEQIFRHLDQGTTDLAAEVGKIPVSRYTSADQLRREQEILFKKYPLLMGFSCQLDSPGSYLTDHFCGTPILVVRNNRGELNAFLNVCTHRGSGLVENCGKTGQDFICPYHGWSFDLEGNLASIPSGEYFPGLNRSDHALRPLPVAEKDGLIWVLPSAGGSIDPDHHLGGLAQEFAHFGLGNYHHYETRILQHKMNWKLVIDTFLEPYHFSVLHRDSVGPILFPNLCLFEPFGLHLRETLPRRSIEQLRNQPRSAWDLITHTAIAYVLFPNTVFVMQGDHVETWRVFPAKNRVDECVMYLDFYIPEPATTESAKGHWARNMDLAIRTVVVEDFTISESMQQRFASGANEHLTTGLNEPALAHYEHCIGRTTGAKD